MKSIITFLLITFAIIISMEFGKVIGSNWDDIVFSIETSPLFIKWKDVNHYNKIKHRKPLPDKELGRGAGR